MADRTLRIPARFNGPPDSANGGYTCGLVAGAMGVDAAEVTLRLPPPLERDLRVESSGSRVSVYDGDALVAEGRPTIAAVQLLEPVDPAQAAEVARASRERWAAAHPFPTCVVCGPDRAAGDGFGLTPGPFGGEGTFVCDWTPDASLAGADGVVSPEYVWAALDCPTSAPVATFGEGPPIVLARLTASLERPVRAGEQHAIVSWALARDGRKRRAGAALFDGAGQVLACSRALWIELAPDPGAP